MATKNDSVSLGPIFDTSVIASQNNLIGSSTLENLGNSCFFNTIIQCLANCSPLRQFVLNYYSTHPIKSSFDTKDDLTLGRAQILAEDIKDSGKTKHEINNNMSLEELKELIKIDNQKMYMKNRLLFHKFTELLRIMITNNYKLNPKKLFNFFCDLSGTTRGVQEDAPEKLTFLLDRFHEGLLVDKIFNGNELIDHVIKDLNISNFTDEVIIDRITRSVEELSHHGYSPISNIFGGQFYYKIICMQTKEDGTPCGNTSTRFEFFNQIILQLPKENKNAPPVTIINLLNSMCTGEKIDYQCDNCGQCGPAQRQQTFWRLPKCLIFQLNRFNWEGHKNSIKVDYTLNNLNLTKYVEYPNTSYVGSDGQVYEDKVTHFYNLKSVACHSGGRSGGHYWAVTRDKDGVVRELNDESYKLIVDKDEFVSREAYLLFYERK